MARVALFADVYLPGFKAGGPVRSISRLVEAEPSHECRVLTRDRDSGDLKAYPQVGSRRWERVGSALVAYLRPRLRDFIWCQSELRSWRPNVVFFNSLHSIEYSLLPLLAWRLSFRPPRFVVIAPRGELSQGAQQHKRIKKRVFRRPIRFLAGPRVVWVLSSARERDDLVSWMGGSLPSRHRTLIRRNEPPSPSVAASPGCSRPEALFASRIDPMKGLDEAIQLVGFVEPEARLVIRGSVKEAAYWQRCRRLAAMALGDDRWTYGGEFTPEDACSILGSSRVLVLPTRGENFGHVIAEALSVGCPVMARDTTLWTMTLDSGGGHVIRGREEAVAYLEEVLFEDMGAATRRRGRVLDAYKVWHRMNLDETSLIDQAIVLGAETCAV